jgi:serine/threonine protein kinase
MDQQELFTFAKERQIVLSALRFNPDQFAATLYSDITSGPFWNRQTTTFSPYLKTNDPNLCCLIGDIKNQVKPRLCLISKVEPLANQGKEGEILRVQIGDINTPKYNILKVFNLDNLRCTFFNGSRNVPSIENTSACFYPKTAELTYLGSDTFTNEYLIGFVLDELYTRPQDLPAQLPGMTPVRNGIIVPSQNLDGITHFLASTICNSGTSKKGVIIMEYADIGDIINIVQNPLTSSFREVKTFIGQDNIDFQSNSLKLPVIIDIIKQVVVNLDFLHSEIDFNHGDLKAANLVVKSVPSNGNYKGVIWNSNFTLKLIDFVKSSLTMTDGTGKRVRLFNYSAAAETYLDFFPFKPVLNSEFGEPYYIMNANFNVSSLAQIRHMGLPFYFSWDTYTFLISLLLIPEIFYPVMTNKILKALLFDSLFFPDELSTIYTKIYAAILNKNSNSYTVITEILKGLKLKCGANTILLNNLKSVGNY